MRSILLLVILVLATGCARQKGGCQSFLPGELWKDNHGLHINAHGGGVLFHEGRYFWYGEHKIEGKAGNKAHAGVHVYSSGDLYNWKDEGIALQVVDNDTTHDITKGCILERPKVIYNRGSDKFVMWFHLEIKGKGYDAARSGIAVADDPKGPFIYVRSVRPNSGYWPLNVQEFHRQPLSDTIKDHYCGGKGCLPSHPDTLNILGRDFKKGQMARDMNLFVDHDGTAYHIYSSEENSTLHISQLSEDYLSYSGKYVRHFVERYMEAPAIFRTAGGKYYLIASDCTGWSPNAARSAVADNIWGPWTELENPCVGPGADVTFNSQSTYVLPVNGMEDAFIFLADRWNPQNAIDGRYIWLPITVSDSGLLIEWYDEWDLSYLKGS